MADMRTHAVLGVVPPQIEEARITQRWPSVAMYMGGAPARLGAALQLQAKALLRFAMDLPVLLAILLMPFFFVIATAIALVAWLMLAPFFFLTVLPFLGTRYTLTNRAIKIQSGIKPQTVSEMDLKDITEVRVVPGSELPFYLAADLEILGQNRAALMLRGVKEFMSFKHQIEVAYLSWGRQNAPKEQSHPASAK